MNERNTTLNKKMLYNIDIVNFLSSTSHQKINVIYFGNTLNKEILNLGSLKNNIIFISQQYVPSQYISLKCINKKILKYLSEKFVIAIDIDNNVSFKYMKYFISNLIRLFQLLKKHNIEFKYFYQDCILYSIASYSPNHPYFKDINVAFEALFSGTLKKQYEIVYDYVCDFLDNEFTCKNICGFSNNICNASRAGLTQCKTNGCCYTITYGPGGIMLGHEPCKYLINKSCSAKCISCKLHTCYYLKMKNIEFKIKDILLLNCFFSYKQWLVLKYNVFKSKDEIINKLLQIRFIPCVLCYPLALYKIN